MSITLALVLAQTEFVHATWLNYTWYALLGVLLVGYAILDGFDLGVGILHAFVPRTDLEKRLCMNSIGPLWDGNEVWLVTFGGALFAAFPNAYATAFSAFYLPFMLLLVALIFRAVSLEFRSKSESRLWRTVWDAGFFGSSTLAPLLFGVAVGDSMVGLPIGPMPEVEGMFRTDHEYIGTLGNLLGFYEAGQGVRGVPLGSIVLNPFPLMTGTLVVVTFALHGGVFLYLKTEGELQQRARQATWVAFGVFVAMFFFTSTTALQFVPHATRNFEHSPGLFLVVVLAVLAVANIPRSLVKDDPAQAFVSTSATIAALVFLFGTALFPYMLLSNVDDTYHLDLTNAASSQSTLWTMFIIAVMGLPIVATYTLIIQWLFRGKVKLGKFSY
jgi:cytochrome d ubiquinol oxidase subunit II